MTENALKLEPGKKVYFASDFHLGVPDQISSIEREKRLTRWLEFIRNDAAGLFLLGDIFDFWFEYSKVIPRGFLRFQGKLAELSDQGIPIYLFKGNHDMWMFEYFPQEINARVFSDPINLTIGNHRFMIGHGDGLGPGDRSYKLLKKIFRNRLCIWLFGILPPRIGMGIAHRWSAGSRISNQEKGEEFLGDDREYLLQYCKEQEKKEHRDYYIFGHRHLVLDLKVTDHSRYINTGEWVTGSPFACYDGRSVTLHHF